MLRTLRQGCLVGLLLLAAHAEPQIQDPIEVRQERLPNGARIFARNRLGVDMTVTLELTDASNVGGSPPLPHTMTVPGHQEVLFSTVRQRNSRDAWTYRYQFFWNYGNMAARHDKNVAYRLPFASGKKFNIMQGFHGEFSHTGDDEYAIDFGCPEGTPVYACRPGVVVSVQEGWSKGGPTEYFRNRVNCLRIRHSDGTVGEYDHFRLNGIAVDEGDTVQAGQLVGYSGNTGYSTGPHLHFVVYRGRDGRRRESFPIYFSFGSGQPVELLQGQTYTAP